MPDLGINLSEVALSVDGDKNRLNLELLARSGEGDLTGDGVIIFQQGSWSFKSSNNYRNFCHISFVLK